jgi:hypothetical protein
MATDAVTDGIRASKGKGRKPSSELTADEKARLDSRSVIESASMNDVKDEPSRYEHWVCRYGGARYVVRHSKRVQGDVVGESFIKPPLVAQFGNGQLFLDRDDPDFDYVSKYLHKHGDIKAGSLVCVSDLEADQRSSIDPETVGKSRRAQLQLFGIRDKGHEKAVREALNIADQKEGAQLREENADLKARVEVLEKKLGQK